MFPSALSVVSPRESLGVPPVPGTQRWDPQTRWVPIAGRSLLFFHSNLSPPTPLRSFP